MKLTALLSCGVLCTALLGCSSQNNNGAKAVSQSDAQRLNAEHSNFKDGEPKLTADTHFAAGQLAEASRAIPNAIEQYHEALKLDPNHLPSLYRLGVILTQLKNYPDALETWHRYVSASNDSATSLANLGFCLEMAGQPNDAEAVYKQGIAKDDKNLACRTNYGLMLARHDRKGEAVRVWTPVLSDAEIHYNLAGVYELDSRKSEARAEYQKALDVDPKFTDARDRLATLDTDSE